MPWQANGLSIGEDSRNYYFIKTTLATHTLALRVFCFIHDLWELYSFNN